MRINQKIKTTLEDPKPHPVPQGEDIGRGFFYRGMTQTGVYIYSRTVNEKEVIVKVSPSVWEDTKHVFEDAIRRHQDPKTSLQKLKQMTLGLSLSGE